jgi:hypothetical protein
MALNVLLGSWVTKPSVLCFSEHWLNKEHLLQINIDYYKLAANFCRISNKYGGTCIYVLNYIKTKELTFVQNLTREGIIEISAIEIVDRKIIIICIYRPPSSSRECFLQLILESNPHPFYSFRGLKNQMRISFACRKNNTVIYYFIYNILKYLSFIIHQTRRHHS